MLIQTESPVSSSENFTPVPLPFLPGSTLPEPWQAGSVWLKANTDGRRTTITGYSSGSPWFTCVKLHSAVRNNKQLLVLISAVEEKQAGQASLTFTAKNFLPLFCLAQLFSTLSTAAQHTTGLSHTALLFWQSLQLNSHDLQQNSGLEISRRLASVNYTEMKLHQVQKFMTASSCMQLLPTDRFVWLHFEA